MSVTLESLKNELEPYKNTLVIDEFDRVVRLVGVVDGEDDYYWVYDGIRGVYWGSCVGGWIPLKGYIPEKNYNKMVSMWNLNHIEKAV